MTIVFFLFCFDPDISLESLKLYRSGSLLIYYLLIWLKLLLHLDAIADFRIIFFMYSNCEVKTLCFSIKVIFIISSGGKEYFTNSVLY